MSSEVRFGNVSSIDYEAGKCEVTYPDRDDTVTEMVPFLSNGEYQTPEVDDLVLVLHPGESPEDAVVVGTVWNEKTNRLKEKKKSTERIMPTHEERHIGSLMQMQKN
jgi:hypothetical protein